MSHSMQVSYRPYKEPDEKATNIVMEFESPLSIIDILTTLNPKAGKDICACYQKGEMVYYRDGEKVRAGFYRKGITLDYVTSDREDQILEEAREKALKIGFMRREKPGQKPKISVAEGKENSQAGSVASADTSPTLPTRKQETLEEEYKRLNEGGEKARAKINAKAARIAAERIALANAAAEAAEKEALAKQVAQRAAAKALLAQQQQQAASSVAAAVQVGVQSASTRIPQGFSRTGSAGAAEPKCCQNPSYVAAQARVKAFFEGTTNKQRESQDPNVSQAFVKGRVKWLSGRERDGTFRLPQPGGSAPKKWVRSNHSTIGAQNPSQYPLAVRTETTKQDTNNRDGFADVNSYDDVESGEYEGKEIEAYREYLDTKKGDHVTFAEQENKYVLNKGKEDLIVVLIDLAEKLEHKALDISLLPNDLQIKVREKLIEAKFETENIVISEACKKKIDEAVPSLRLGQY